MSKIAKTPLGREIILPNAALTAAILAENDKIKPLTSIASIAIDIAREKREELINDILSYIDTDMICYRSDSNYELLNRQETLLNPIVNWAEEKFATKIKLTRGIMPVAQSKEVHLVIRNIIENYNEWQLAAFVTLAKPFCSLILALCVMENKISAEKAFSLSQIEENFSSEKWGEDIERTKTINNLRLEVLAAERFLELYPSSMNIRKFVT
ncbi:MAG: ATP12 family protein [Pseudomonadota bacterium]